MALTNWIWFVLAPVGTFVILAWLASRFIRPRPSLDTRTRAVLWHATGKHPEDH